MLEEREPLQVNLVPAIIFAVAMPLIGFSAGYYWNDEWDWRDKIKEIDAKRECDAKWVTRAWMVDINGKYHCVEVDR